MHNLDQESQADPDTTPAKNSLGRGRVLSRASMQSRRKADPVTTPDRKHGLDAVDEARPSKSRDRDLAPCGAHCGAREPSFDAVASESRS